MKVGIVGAGSIAFGSAALLEQNGHEVTLWSPSGERTRALAKGEPLVAEGAITGTFHPRAAADARELVDGAQALLVALPVYGHKAVLDAIAPHIRPGQIVIINSHASFGALYLSRLLAARGVAIPIVAWGTTAVSGRQLSPGSVKVNTVRKQVDMATVPASRSAEGLAACKALFGDRFVDRGSLMAIALSNLNPQNHMAIALGNMSRMEHGETWHQCRNVTPKIGRLMEKLDAERIAIAAALGLQVKDIFQHYHLSFHTPVASISEMNQALFAAGKGGNGPTTADTRYVTEDVPFGLVVTAWLGRLAGRPAPLHESGIAIFSAMYDRDFASANDLLGALDLEGLSLGELQDLCRHGFAPAAAA